MAEPRREIRKFAEHMEARLAANDHKGGWSRCKLKWLLGRLEGEVAELRGIVESYCAGFGDDDEHLIREAADVANFAMMIADNVRLPNVRE